MAFGVAMLRGRNAGISPEMRSRELEALRSAWNIWNEHRQTSQDAARAVRVLGPIIRKASAVESLPQTTATYPSPVEGVPVAVAVEKIETLGEITTASPSTPVYDWIDHAAIDAFLSDPNNIDWVSHHCSVHV